MRLTEIWDWYRSCVKCQKCYSKPECRFYNGLLSAPLCPCVSKFLCVFTVKYTVRMLKYFYCQNWIVILLSPKFVYLDYTVYFITLYILQVSRRNIYRSCKTEEFAGGGVWSHTILFDASSSFNHQSIVFKHYLCPCIWAWKNNMSMPMQLCWILFEGTME